MTNNYPKISYQEKINNLSQSFDLLSADIISIEGFFYRTINYRYSFDPLSTKGAEITGGRYNFKPKSGQSFSCLYCGNEEFTATIEKYYNLKISDQPRPPHTTVSIEVKLSKILDLRTPEMCQKAGIDWYNINQSWTYDQDVLGRPSYTQEIGRLVYEDGGIEGIIFTSTKNPQGSCLAIYTQRMLLGSYISVYDPNNELPETNKIITGLSTLPD